MAEQASDVSYEQLAQIELEFDEIENEMLRKQYALSKAVYEKRQALISKIPNFWPLVFEQAPPEIDHYIQPTDSEIISKALTGLDVQRFEAEEGSPRSLQFCFEFAENEWFTNKTLEKKFWFRKSKDGWSGLVSEPVRIDWKKGKDLTQGLLNGAIKLWDARKKAGDMNKKGLPEAQALEKLIESWNGENTSFFTWFAYISSGPYVSAEESAEAIKADSEKKTREASDKEDESDEEDLLDLDPGMEVHEAGDDLANLIAEDLWPGAIKYFTQAQEMDGMSDMEFEDDMDSDSDGEPVDIRAILGKSGSKDDAGPPKKKQKK